MDGLAWVVLEKCPAVVPCATADEESGSKFKTWILFGSTLRVTRCEKIALKILFFQMNPCIKLAFRKLNPSLILDLPCALYSIYTPFVGVVGLAEYVCTHHFSNFYRGRSRLCSRGRWVGGSVLHPTLPMVLALFRMLSLARYSEPELDPMCVVLWCITVAFLLFVIVCLECPPPRRIVRLCTIWCNKYVSAFWDWYL